MIQHFKNNIKKLYLKIPIPLSYPFLPSIFLKVKHKHKIFLNYQKQFFDHKY